MVAVSDEHGERFHHYTSQTEERYRGKLSPDILANHCWSLEGGQQLAKIRGERRK